MEEPFNGIKNLKGFLEKEKKLQIIHRTEIWEASFSWNLPTTRDAVKKKREKNWEKVSVGFDFVSYLNF